MPEKSTVSCLFPDLKFLLAFLRGNGNWEWPLLGHQRVLDLEKWTFWFKCFLVFVFFKMFMSETLNQKEERKFR